MDRPGAGGFESTDQVAVAGDVIQAVKGSDPIFDRLARVVPILRRLLVCSERVDQIAVAGDKI